MWFDAELSMRSHVSRVAQTCFYHLRQIHAVRRQLGHVTAKLVTALVLSRLDYSNAMLAGLPASTLAPCQRVLHAAARTVLDLKPRDSSSSRVALVTSRREDPVQFVLAGSQVASGTYVGIHLGPPDAGCQNSESICSTHLVAW